MSHSLLRGFQLFLLVFSVSVSAAPANNGAEIAWKDSPITCTWTDSTGRHGIVVSYDGFLVGHRASYRIIPAGGDVNDGYYPGYYPSVKRNLLRSDRPGYSSIVSVRDRKGRLSIRAYADSRNLLSEDAPAHVTLTTDRGETVDQDVSCFFSGTG